MAKTAAYATRSHAQNVATLLSTGVNSTRRAQATITSSTATIRNPQVSARNLSSWSTMFCAVCAASSATTRSLKAEKLQDASTAMASSPMPAAVAALRSEGSVSMIVMTCLQGWSLRRGVVGGGAGGTERLGDGAGSGQLASGAGSVVGAVASARQVQAYRTISAVQRISMTLKKA